MFTCFTSQKIMLQEEINHKGFHLAFRPWPGARPATWQVIRVVSWNAWQTEMFGVS